MDISRGQITFGAAADEEYGYFGLRGGALAAVRLKDGVEQWNTYIEPQPGMESERGRETAACYERGSLEVLDTEAGDLSEFHPCRLKQNRSFVPM